MIASTAASTRHYENFKCTTEYHYQLDQQQVKLMSSLSQSAPDDASGGYSSTNKKAAGPSSTDQRWRVRPCAQCTRREPRKGETRNVRGKTAKLSRIHVFPRDHVCRGSRRHWSDTCATLSDDTTDVMSSRRAQPHWRLAATKGISPHLEESEGGKDELSRNWRYEQCKRPVKGKDLASRSWCRSTLFATLPLSRTTTLLGHRGGRAFLRTLVGCLDVPLGTH